MSPIVCVCHKYLSGGGGKKDDGQNGSYKG